MFSSGGGTGGKKQRPATGYLVRPKMGALKSVYSNRPLTSYGSDKRKKLKKSTLPKMEWRRKPDYADTAYREAVGRLRILLAESYAPIKRPIRDLDSAGEETDNQSLISVGSRNSRLGRSYFYYPLTPRKYYYPPPRSNYTLPGQDKPDPPKLENTTAPPELMSFIERQEDYIEQLEKESKFCREELSSLLNKVKDVISENENLHERQKSKLIKSVFEHLETETETETEVENKNVIRSPKKSKKTRIIEGPSIVYESRISELEAQLTQSKIDLKKSQEENENFRKKINDGTILESVGYESYKKQIETIQREKQILQETVQKLQSALALSRDKENDTCDKVKRSLDVAEQAQYEKNAAETEIRRLKDELERQHLKLRDAIGDQSRRIADERSAAERRYTQQIEQLTAELGVQWETTNKLQLELDKQRRENSDLRREVTQKQALIDELKKDMQTKIITLQSDIGVTGAEKSALEQQIATLQMANERSERQSKQEIGRLQAEIQSWRQRMDRADADLIHSRRENIRLTEQVASLEKEIALNTAISDERSKTPRSGDIVALPPPKPDNREKELSSMMHDMESKHAATVAELESMIFSQNQLMDKLSTECHALTMKLEDASIRHKEEIRELQTNLEYLSNRFSQSQMSSSAIKDERRPSDGNRRSPPKPRVESLITEPIRTVSPTKTKPEVRRESLSRTNSKRSMLASFGSRQSSLEKPNVPSPSQRQPLQNRQHSSEQQKTPYQHEQPLSSYEEEQQNSRYQVEPTYQKEEPQYISEQQYSDNAGFASRQSGLEKPNVPSSSQRQPLQNQQHSSEHQKIPYQHEQPISSYEEEQQNSRYQAEPTYQDEQPPYISEQQYSDNAGHYVENYDANQQYNPTHQYAQDQEYDPNDPSQQYVPTQYEPDQEYDPNQHYTSTQPYDPNQQYEGENDQQYRGKEQEPYQMDPNDPIQQYAVEPVTVPVYSESDKPAVPGDPDIQ